MDVGGTEFRTVWMEGSFVFMINQNKLPFEFEIHECRTYKQSCEAIKNMTVRGAGAIGATAAFAMAQAFVQGRKSDKKDYVETARQRIEASRPTARNLFYATEKVYEAGKISIEDAIIEAQQLADKDAHDSVMIGKYGNELIKDKDNILTHCNAGWLAFVDYGTALSPVYNAHNKGKDIFVYADETRPRGQGARLTAWELQNENIPHKIIPDNAAASLMAMGEIDLVIVGADRIALNGDVANKIGTLEKAIAAKYYNIPFFIAAPTSTFDMSCSSGEDIIIEERSQNEVFFQEGPDEDNVIRKIRVSNPGSEALNLAFDVTPAKLITKIITENGAIDASSEAIKRIMS